MAVIMLAYMLGMYSKMRLNIAIFDQLTRAHYWRREIGRLGYEVRLVAAAYVKPLSSGRRTTRRMPRRSARLPGDRPCASWR
jgi:transposase